MSRRDTIIIAVLVNAAILLILFATAMRSDSKKSKEEATPLVKEEVSENMDELVAANIPDNPVDDTAIEILGGSETEIPVDSSATNANATVPPVVTATAATPATTPAVTQPAKTQAIKAPTPATPVAAQVQPLAIPKALSTPSQKEEMISVTVKKGDALEKIARANHSTVAAISKANNLTSTQLKIGQVLKVPTVAAEKAPVEKATLATTAAATAAASTTAPAPVKKEIAQTAKPSTSPSSSQEGIYTVKEGDNPWLIATRMGIKVEDLLRLNGIDNEKAKRLRPGDKLRIR